MKVRWQQKCAKCPTVLTVGARAIRIHGHLWCLTCARSHNLTCRTEKR